MKRKTFLKISAAGAATLFIPIPFLQGCSNKSVAAALDSNFMVPPQAAKPYTW